MTAPRRPSRFRERTVRTGWVGARSVAQPAENDRVQSMQSLGLAIEFSPAERIARIVHDGPNSIYYLANGTTITAPSGARITWEES
ncbi:hypothetical protein ACFY9N_11590 [Microbacterium sp. NPDC008134]|jgi:hypothetical protein|uniref:hypothetical protein n=1 Tax=Microbacterium sp. NPDC008134 TaxID=3364183 RepID=UPI0036E7AA52